MKGAFRRKCLKNFKESDGMVQKIYGASALFIGVGGSFKKTPRYDCCEVSGVHVSTLTFRG
jgi:hypothetical protein